MCDELKEKPGASVTSFGLLDAAIKAVDAEPELPGSMPDEIWDAIKNDRDAAEELLRIVVRQTKVGIIDRLLFNDKMSLKK